MRISVKAPLKAILAGEHAVVYGYPAVAVALDTYVRVTAEPGDDSFRVETELSCEGNVRAEITRDGNVKGFRSESLHEELTYVATAVRKASEEFDAPPSNLRILSEAPPASGLGTSAAVTAAVLLGLAEVSGVNVSREEIRRLVREVELEVQGKASWTDATVVTYGGFVRVSGREFELIEPERNPVLVVAHSQEPSRTGEMVRRVAELRERLDIVDGVMELIGELVDDLEAALRGWGLKDRRGAHERQPRAVGGPERLHACPGGDRTRIQERGRLRGEGYRRRRRRMRGRVIREGGGCETCRRNAKRLRLRGVRHSSEPLRCENRGLGILANNAFIFLNATSAIIVPVTRTASMPSSFSRRIRYRGRR